MSAGLTSVRAWLRAPHASDVLILVSRIAVIIFTVELLIMATLSRWQFSWSVIQEALIDSTSLTLISSPLIYRWVVEPFVRSANEARAALADRVHVQTGQASKLECALAELRQLLGQNEELHRNLQLSNRSVAEINEQVLQRIGADLHDGPAQLLAFALLRLNKLNLRLDEGAPRKGEDLHQQISTALSDALSEVRTISSGLSLPHLETASLAQTILLAVALHEERTGTKVLVTIDELPASTPHALKICAYRFVQEGLTNAYRHANAAGQRVVAAGGERLVISVADSGPGLNQKTARKGLGLTGMKARIEAIGGTLAITAKSDSGTRLIATFENRAASDE